MGDVLLVATVLLHIKDMSVVTVHQASKTLIFYVVLVSISVFVCLFVCFFPFFFLTTALYLNVDSEKDIRQSQDSAKFKIPGDGIHQVSWEFMSHTIP